MRGSGDGASDGKLQIRAGGLHDGILYDDPKGDFGIRMVRAVALYSQTVLSGVTILSSKIWVKDESPYLITGMKVNEGATLTITKGVRIFFGGQ